MSGSTSTLSPCHGRTSHLVGGFSMQRHISAGRCAPCSALNCCRTWRSSDQEIYKARRVIECKSDSIPSVMALSWAIIPSTILSAASLYCRRRAISIVSLLNDIWKDKKRWWRSSSVTMCCWSTVRCSCESIWKGWERKSQEERENKTNRNRFLTLKHFCHDLSKFIKIV